jgi:hypothetical protein
MVAPEVRAEQLTGMLESISAKVAPHSLACTVYERIRLHLFDCCAGWLLQMLGIAITLGHDELKHATAFAALVVSVVDGSGCSGNRLSSLTKW